MTIYREGDRVKVAAYEGVVASVGSQTYGYIDVTRGDEDDEFAVSVDLLTKIVEPLKVGDLVDSHDIHRLPLEAVVKPTARPGDSRRVITRTGSNGWLRTGGGKYLETDDVRALGPVTVIYLP